MSCWLANSGSWFGGHIVRRHLFTAFAAYQGGIGDLSAVVVTQHDRRSLRSGKVSVPPAHEQRGRAEQLAAGTGEAIFVPIRIARIENALEQARVDHRPQA